MFQTLKCNAQRMACLAPLRVGHEPPNGSCICGLASSLFRANWFLGSCPTVFLDGPALSSGDEDAEDVAELPEVALEPAEPRTSQQVGHCRVQAVNRASPVLGQG